MPLSEKALCTVEDVEAELGGVVDSRFAGWVEDASEAIADYLKRVLERDAAIVEKHGGEGSPFLLLKRMPINAITSIVFDGSTVDSTSYEIHESEAGIIYFIGLPTVRTGYVDGGVASRVVPGTERKLYTVTYDAGWITPGQSALSGGDYEGDTVTLPRAIRRACVDIVVQMYNDVGRDARVANESTMSHSVGYRADGDGDEGSGIPLSIRSKISRYRIEDGA